MNLESCDNTIMRFQAFIWILLMILSVFSTHSLAQQRSNDEICDDFKMVIRSGAEPRTALRDALKTRPELCPMVRCALESGIPLRAVQLASRDAGVKDDAVVGCTTSTCNQTFRLFETDGLCKSIKQEVEKGRSGASLIVEKIRQGNEPCKVLRCATAAGADLDDVIKAARDENVSDDVISRCCMDGCADPFRIARILREYENLTSADNRRPGGPKSGYLSPSGF